MPTFAFSARDPRGRTQRGTQQAASALDLANQQLSRQYNQDFSKLVEKYTIAGSPADCIARLQEYIDAGARTIMFSQGCPPDYVDENTRLIAETILPAFR